jgi:hypothetical protein
MTLSELNDGFLSLGTIHDSNDSEDDSNAEGEFMFGDYCMGAPTLQPLKLPSESVQPKRSSHTQIQDTQVRSPDPKIPNEFYTQLTRMKIDIPPEQCMQNVYDNTLRIARDWATKKYIRQEPEDISGIRSLTSVSSELSWNPGLK